MYFACCVSDGIRTTIPVGEECVININTADAGYGNVTCHIRSTSGSDVDIDIVDNGDGTVSILYTPRLPGAYTLNIKFGGQPVPKGQFTQQVLNTPFTRWSWLDERTRPALVERWTSALVEQLRECLQNITPFKWPDSQLIKPALRAHDERSSSARRAHDERSCARRASSSSQLHRVNGV